MKRRLPILILLAAAIAAGVYLYPRLTRKTEPQNQLTLSGNIEAHESLVSFKVQGRIVDLPVEEGQRVEPGALLARLDDADYRQRVRIGEATVNVRESNLALMLAGTRNSGSECVGANDAQCTSRSRGKETRRRPRSAAFRQG